MLRLIAAMKTGIRAVRRVQLTIWIGAFTHHPAAAYSLGRISRIAVCFVN
jgi:hypothetical protein